MSCHGLQIAVKHSSPPAGDQLLHVHPSLEVVCWVFGGGGA